MDFDLARTIDILERTPAVLRSLLGGLGEDWTAQDSDGTSWSPYDILGHLIHGERTDWIARTQIILSDAPPEERTFTLFDRHAQERESAGQGVATLLDTFAELRGANLVTLSGLGLTAEQFARTGVHPEFGTVTLAELLSTWAAHDLGHLAQTARVMAKGYREAVGPWRAYLPVMDR